MSSRGPYQRQAPEFKSQLCQSTRKFEEGFQLTERE